MGSEGSDKSEAQTKYSIEIEHTSSEDNVLTSPLTEHTLECSPAMFKRRFSVGSSTKKLLSKLKLNTGSAEHINSFKGDDIQENLEAKSSWTEHVWCTFIHRGYSDEVTHFASRTLIL